MKWLLLILSLYSSSAFSFMSQFPNGEDIICVSRAQNERHKSKGDDLTRDQFALYSGDVDFNGRRERVTNFKEVSALSKFMTYTVTNEEKDGECVLAIKRKVSNGPETKIEILPEPGLTGSYKAVMTTEIDGDEKIDNSVSCRVSSAIIKSKGCLKEPEYPIYSFSGPGPGRGRPNNQIGRPRTGRDR